jgi:hypothetical protein
MLFMPGIPMLESKVKISGNGKMSPTYLIIYFSKHSPKYTNYRHVEDSMPV